MRISVSRAFVLSGVLGWAVLTLVNCASRPPDVRAEPESKIVVPPAPKISLKPFHRSMREEMEKSFEKADEVLIGVYNGTFADGPLGRAYYFDQVLIFNQETWTWGSEMDVLLPILFEKIRPEIIASREFKILSDLDKTGICWDDYEGPRSLYLVEGVSTLVFLRQILDEADNTSRRVLIDTYPLTKECRAKDVFDLMLRERAEKQPVKRADAFLK
jgi:hypothetical protein